MSLRRIPGRLKKNNVFEILPYMILKQPELEPQEILGTDKYTKSQIKEVFDFIAMPKRRRNVLYSIDDFKFKCLYCGKEIIEIGSMFNTMIGYHRKECKYPFFTIDDKYIIQIFKKIGSEYDTNHLILVNKLSNQKIEFHLKKKYNNSKYLEKLDLLKNDLYQLKKSDDITILSIMETYNEYFKIKKNE